MSRDIVKGHIIKDIYLICSQYTHTVRSFIKAREVKWIETKEKGDQTKFCNQQYSEIVRTLLVKMDVKDMAIQY